MAVGSSALYEVKTGMMMALLLALHNLPEGMGMIVPLRSGGVGKGKALFLVALSGLPTLIGGIAGVLLGSISPVSVSYTHLDVYKRQEAARLSVRSGKTVWQSGGIGSP